MSDRLTDEELARIVEIAKTHNGIALVKRTSIAALCELQERRAADQDLRRRDKKLSRLADVCRGYYNSHGALPTSSGLDLLDTIDEILVETVCPCGACNDFEHEHKEGICGGFHMTLTDEQLTDLVVGQHNERLKFVAREAVHELRSRRSADLELDDYEAVNLLWLLRVAREIGLDTGDWLGQLLFKMEKRGTGAVREPNSPPSDTSNRLDWFARARLMSAEDIATLREIRAEIDEFGMAVDDDATAGITPARRRALSVLDRLLAETGRK